MINLNKKQIKTGVLIPIENITINDYNPNRVSERVNEAIQESLTDYGQISELIVRPDPAKKGHYIIIDGEHRYLNLRENKSVYCTVVDNLSEVEYKKLTVILNRTRGEDDPDDLTALLNNIYDLIEDQDEMIRGLPYTESDLNQLLEQCEDDDNNDDEGYFIPEDNKGIDENALSETKHECPKCGFKY